MTQYVFERIALLQELNAKLKSLAVDHLGTPLAHKRAVLEIAISVIQNSSYGKKKLDEAIEAHPLYDKAVFKSSEVKKLIDSVYALLKKEENASKRKDSGNFSDAGLSDETSSSDNLKPH